MAVPPFSSISRELSTDMESGRATVWHFNALFHADGDQRAKTCLDTSHGVYKFGMVRHLLKTHLMTKERPACIGYIEAFLSVRCSSVAQAKAKTALSDISFEGFLVVLKSPNKNPSD
jgi:hypothetical protein